MRRRRAERCLLRAEVALDAGFEDEARAALDEARRLDWQSPDFDSLKARIDQRRAAEAAQRSGRRRLAYLAAALLAIVAAGATFFMSDRTEAPGAATAANVPSPATVTAPAVPVAEPPSPPPEAPAPPETQPAPVATPEKPQTSTEPSRMERPLSARTALNAGVTAFEPPVRQAAREVRELPQIAVPTSSLPVQQAVPDVTATIGRSSIGSVTPPEPVAEARVPDLPPPPPVTPTPAPRAEPPPLPDDSGVRAALAQYESAYSSLNASAAHAVYPGVDEQSLERAFDALDSQRVSLGRCAISMSGARAQATCEGRSTVTPKVGGGTQSFARTWRFDLANAGGSWKITRADAR